LGGENKKLLQTILDRHPTNFPCAQICPVSHFLLLRQGKALVKITRIHIYFLSAVPAIFYFFEKGIRPLCCEFPKTILRNPAKFAVLWDFLCPYWLFYPIVAAMGWSESQRED
jgi:hypothetical protein